MAELPTSPPTPPVVPWGPGSSIGVGSGVLALVGALVDAIAGEGVDADTRALIVSGVAALVLTALGRMFQAGMAYLSRHGVNVPVTSQTVPFRSERGQVNLLVVAILVVVLVIVVLALADRV